MHKEINAPEIFKCYNQLYPGSLPLFFCFHGASNMSKYQQRVLLTLSMVGLAYFALFFYPNSYGAGSDAILLRASGDEYVTYPNVLRILTPGKTFYETRANLFLYEDYHYGYPFYALSALVLLPVRLSYGANISQHMQLNLLLLRQFISILPMILAAGLLVFTQTHFQSLLKSTALFIFLLTIRGVVRNHLWWWHPDALAVLFVVLVLFFLDRDRLRFGWNFYLGAFFCGLATAIKLLGLFFFLTIPAYLLIGLLWKRLTLPKAAIASGLFVAVMVGVVVLSNPFLFSEGQRARMLQIQAQKSTELSQGYQHDNPIYYSKGPQWWASTLEKWYAPPLFIIFLLISLIAGCLRGTGAFANRLILSWIIPYSIYLLYFVAVKPDHYWLPVMLPLFSCAFCLPEKILQRWSIFRSPFFTRAIAWQKIALVLIALVLAAHLVTNFTHAVSGIITQYLSTIQTGITLIQTIP